MYKTKNTTLTARCLKQRMSLTARCIKQTANA